MTRPLIIDSFAGGSASGSTDRPIIFSAPMIRALLDGRKTQTRRIFVPPAPFAPEDDITVELATGSIKARWQVGDRLWVREAWRAPVMNDDVAPRDLGIGMTRAFEADDEQLVGAGHDAVACPLGAAGKLRPSIFLPRWASRLTLIVTDVRVERLNDISEADARAEGLACLTKDDGRTWKYGLADRDGWPGTDDYGWPWSDWNVDPRRAFATLWSRIHGPDAWAANPWVAAISFVVHRANIDALPAPSPDPRPQAESTSA